MQWNTLENSPEMREHRRSYALGISFLIAASVVLAILMALIISAGSTSSSSTTTIEGVVTKIDPLDDSSAYAYVTATDGKTWIFKVDGRPHDYNPRFWESLGDYVRVEFYDGDIEEHRPPRVKAWENHRLPVAGSTF